MDYIVTQAEVFEGLVKVHYQIPSFCEAETCYFFDKAMYVYIRMSRCSTAEKVDFWLTGHLRILKKLEPHKVLKYFKV